MEHKVPIREAKVIGIWLDCVVVRNWDKMQIEENTGNFTVRNAENKIHMYLYLFIYLHMCVSWSKVSLCGV
jgi:hypothetical protein